MSIRRFTRLTNAFSQKIENHAAAVVIWFMYYNFCCVHQTLRVTPAMESAGSQIMFGVRKNCVGCCRGRSLQRARSTRISCLRRQVSSKILSEVPIIESPFSFLAECKGDPFRLGNTH